jgi:hypothetical protein|uniref:Uncharacterized protein n=1 Tax=viral metagenome TaxID=1070528 RepID=A0A6C0ILN0_9ZZZZ
MAKLGLKIKIGNEEKDLDDIFLKISDYNANSSNYQDGEAVQLTQETGIKYIDENGVKRDLIERYIGYDSDGYIAENYETDPNRIDVSSLNSITDINDNNLVNLFYQLGTKKVSENLIDIQNGDYYIRVTNNSSNANYRFQFNFPVGTIIWMEIINGNIYIKNNNKTTTFLSVTYIEQTLSTSNISLNQSRFNDSFVYNTFLRNNDSVTYYLSRSNSNKQEAKCIIIS